jgi:hypothetical protein
MGKIDRVGTLGQRHLSYWKDWEAELIGVSSSESDPGLRGLESKVLGERRFMKLHRDGALTRRRDAALHAERSVKASQGQSRPVKASQGQSRPVKASQGQSRSVKVSQGQIYCGSN